MKNLGGRPPKYNNPKKLEKIINNYFLEEDKPTLTGLAIYLGMSRETLNQYKNKDMFSDIIKKAREKVMAIYEEKMIYANNPTGVIFALKNMGWKDRQDVTTNDKDIPTPIYGGKSTQ